MPTAATLLRVFLASPGDVVEEREAVAKELSDLNLVFGNRLGVLFQLVSWETDTHPGVGADPQDVINTQIADQYDIFLGIMSTRFGTPTARAGSGTQEEFERALARFRKDPDSVRVMFYFKDPLLRASAIDLQEFAKVLAFKSGMGGKGTYYWEFSTPDEFARLIRFHLSAQAQEFRHTWGLRAETQAWQKNSGAIFPAAPDLAEEAPDVTEPGYIDLLDTALEDLQKSTAAMMRMTEATRAHGERLDARNAEFGALRHGGAVPAPRDMKRVSNLVAEDMRRFALLINSEIQEYGPSFSRSIDAFTRAFLVMQEDGLREYGDLESLITALTSYDSTLHGNRTTLQTVKETIQALPRATGDLNRSKRAVISALDTLSGEMQVASNLLTELRKRLQAATSSLEA